jgi:adenylate cyclase
MAARSFDLLSTLSPPVPATPGAVIVAIDEPSFSALQRQWPWPRDTHAQLIAALRAAGARVIAFDVVFGEPGQGDAALAQAARADTVFAADESLIETPQASSLVRTEPIPDLLAGGAHSGVASVSIDGDGVLRRIPAYPDSFTRRIARVAGAPAQTGGKLIQYFGPAGSYPRVSYYQALDPTRFLPHGFFRGRTVIVGYSLQATPVVASGGADAFETPYTAVTGLLTPGVEAQATILDNLIHGLAIRGLPAWAGTIALLAGAAAAVMLSGGARPALRGLSVLVAILACVVATWLLLRFGRIWLSPFDPAAALAAIWAGLAVRDYARELRLRREVQSAFSQYLAPEMVERILRDPSLLKLGGERREMTMLFADIRGFTSISEAMKGDPQGLTRMINGILTPLSDIVLAEGGTIDKYMGDCIMAFWNAPLDQPDHATRALTAAIAMEAALPAINAAIRSEMPEDGAALDIRIGIGLNSGECVVGNMGSAQRFDYSVLGDAVNIASRLESLSKQYGVPIVIGEATARLLPDADLIEIDRTAVRGKQESIAVFTLRRFREGAG